MDLLDRYRGALLGLACGDALGAPVEFKKPGTFVPVREMTGGGAFHLPPGYWTDDTSMALCLAESLVEGGACVIVSTSELPELINLAARIYVMHEGRVVAELGEDERSEAQILPHYFGGTE